MPVKISLVPDVAPVIRAAGDLGDAFENVAGSLDDLGRDAQRAGDRIGEGVQDGTREASTAAERLERSFADMVKTVSKSTKKVGDDIGDDVKRGTRDAESGLNDFKSEAASTARESAASFDGSADSIGDSFQEVAANALAGFGPLGAGAGLALAAGFGIFRANAEKETAAAKQAVSDMFDDMIESGAEFLSKEAISQGVIAIYKGAEDAAIKIDELRKLATTAEIPEPLLARALVGDAAAREQVKTAISEQRAAITATIDEATARGSNMAPAMAPAIEALLDIEAELDKTSGKFGEAQQNAAAATAAVNGIIAPTQGVAASAEDARSKFDGLGRQIANSPPVRVSVDVDTSAASSTLDLWRRRQSAMGVAVGARVGVQQPV